MSCWRIGMWRVEVGSHDHPADPEHEGSVVLEGRKFSKITRRALRTERVNFQMIFQDPYASLNPRMTVYDTLAEAIKTRQQIGAKLLLEKVAQFMRTVGLPPNQMRGIHMNFLEANVNVSRSPGPWRRNPN